MKVILIVYAIIAMCVQVLLGLLTGNGQGSIGLLIFLLLVEIDPRFSFTYMVPNIKKRLKKHRIEGETS